MFGIVGERTFTRWRVQNVRNPRFRVPTFDTMTDNGTTMMIRPGTVGRTFVILINKRPGGNHRSYRTNKISNGVRNPGDQMMSTILSYNNRFKRFNRQPLHPIAGLYYR